MSDLEAVLKILEESGTPISKLEIKCWHWTAEQWREWRRICHKFESGHGIAAPIPMTDAVAKSAKDSREVKA